VRCAGSCGMALASGVDQRVAQRERVDELDQPRARRAARTLSPLSHLVLLLMGLVCATRVLEGASGYLRGHRVRHLVLLSALSLRLLPRPPPHLLQRVAPPQPRQGRVCSARTSATEHWSRLVALRPVQVLSSSSCSCTTARTPLCGGSPAHARAGDPRARSAARDLSVQCCRKPCSLLCAVDTLKAGPPARARFLRRGLAAARGRRCSRAGSS